MAALFACTRCHRRYPFEDLSHGEQLCKECCSNYPVVKCTYCRAEFQLKSKNSSATICSKCAENVKAYGKPKACEYCSILAAFIGRRCQRCVNSEKKWGPPFACEQCKLKCAFNRDDESKRKVDGKNLCWLCTQAYKRVLAKTRKNQDFTVSAKKSSSGQDNSLENRISLLTQPGSSDNKSGLAAAIMKMASDNAKHSTSTASGSVENQVFGVAVSASSSGTSENKSASNGHHHKHNKSKSLSEQTSSLLDRTTGLGEKGSEGGKEKEGKHHRSHHRSRSHGHHHHHHHHSKHHHHRRHHQTKPEEADESSTPKKQKLDKSVSNGVSVSTPKSTGSNVSDAGVMDTNNSENVILITQLREQIESLKKQLSAKDAQLLEKEKKITELKAENYEAEKESRTKVQNLQRQHEEAISNLQVKNRELQRQVTKLSKGVKKSVLDSITSSS